MRRPTKTDDLFLFDGEFVVVSDLLPRLYVSLGVDDNLLVVTDVDDLGVTVGLWTNQNIHYFKV